MIIKTKPTSNGRRHSSYISSKKYSTKKPLKALSKIKSKITGRNNQGKITIRHRGGAQKRKLRQIDFRRNKFEVVGKVVSIEYDPNRSADIALINYADGDKRYILAPDGMVVGHEIVSSDKAEIKAGNSLPLRVIPLGTPIHNIELTPGKGGQMVRGAGTAAIIQSKEGKFAQVLLPSKELRLISLDSRATIGQVSNQEHKIIKYGKAGRRRHMGWRPSVRGVAMHPAAHPHGGGEGRSGIGMKAPKTPWGKKALGKKTRKLKKYSNRYIIRDRRSK